MCTVHQVASTPNQMHTGKYYKTLAGRMRLKVAADLTNYDAFAKEGYYASNTDKAAFQVGELGYFWDMA